MPRSRLIKHNLSWAPKTLAVISCALALLAVQPAATAASVKTRPAVIGTSGGIVTPSSARPSMGERAIRTPTKPDRAVQSTFYSAQQFHILATVEILHRLLVRELQMPQRHILPLAWFQPVCIEILPLSTDATERPIPQVFPLPPPVERAFAISRQLLAPPVA